MTPERFFTWLHKLKDAGFTAYLADTELIRLARPDGRVYCPITGVCFMKTGCRYNELEVANAVKILGISRLFYMNLLEAADWSDHELIEINELRQQLLEVLDLLK